MIRTLAVAATLALAASAVQAQTGAVTVPLKGNKGEDMGRAILTPAPKGVLMRVEAKGLTPGWHGLHFHEKADCSKSDFTSAGGHTHGGGDRIHGLLNPKANETGDLPNLFAGKDGSAMAEVYSTLTTLQALRDADGSAVLIHASADDHATQPIGGAGARVACGEIK